MSLESWLLFCLTQTVLCFTPGPAVLLVISLSLTRGAGAGFRAGLGILGANATYFAISATSLGALLLTSRALFTVVKWLGATYLVWRGIRMVLSPSRDLAGGSLESHVGNARSESFRYGVLTQGANPKAFVFFTAIVPQFINPASAIGAQLMILGATAIVIELVVLSIYVVACHQTRGLVRNPRFAAPLERIGGVLLIGAGVRLVTTSRG